MLFSQATIHMLADLGLGIGWVLVWFTQPLPNSSAGQHWTVYVVEQFGYVAGFCALANAGANYHLLLAAGDRN